MFYLFFGNDGNTIGLGMRFYITSSPLVVSVAIMTEKIHIIQTQKRGVAELVSRGPPASAW